MTGVQTCALPIWGEAEREGEEDGGALEEPLKRSLGAGRVGRNFYGHFFVWLKLYTLGKKRNCSFYHPECSSTSRYSLHQREAKVCFCIQAVNGSENERNADFNNRS